jgi:hypothetical protein
MKHLFIVVVAARIMFKSDASCFTVIGDNNIRYNAKVAKSGDP